MERKENGDGKKGNDDKRKENQEVPKAGEEKEKTDRMETGNLKRKETNKKVIKKRKLAENRH